MKNRWREARKGKREKGRRKEGVRETQEQDVRKEGEEGGSSKVVEVKTDRAKVKRRTKQRRQPGRDEASVKFDGRMFRTIQMFVKVDGCQAFPLEVSLSDKVGDVVKRIPSSACDSKRDVYMTCEGRVIRRSDDLKGCGISDGGTLQVTPRLRGGRHKGQEESSREEARSQNRHEDRKLSFSRGGTQAIWTRTTRGTANQVMRVEETDNSRRCLGVRTGGTSSPLWFSDGLDGRASGRVSTSET